MNFRVAPARIIISITTRDKKNQKFRLEFFE